LSQIQQLSVIVLVLRITCLDTPTYPADGNCNYHQNAECTSSSETKKLDEKHIVKNKKLNTLSINESQ